jgi:hypothetical protein
MRVLELFQESGFRMKMAECLQKLRGGSEINPLALHELRDAQALVSGVHPHQHLSHGEGRKRGLLIGLKKKDSR